MITWHSINFVIQAVEISQFFGQPFHHFCVVNRVGTFLHLIIKQSILQEWPLVSKNKNTVEFTLYEGW